jgi:o-succinylbenzoate synthase
MSEINFSVFQSKLDFIAPARTSRDVLLSKPSFFIRLIDTASDRMGWGEVSLIPGLSVDTENDVGHALEALVGTHPLDRLEQGLYSLQQSVRFGVETALHSMKAQHPFMPFDSAFARGEQGIHINGLIWMGTEKDMLTQMHARAREGFRVLKMKVGAGDFSHELALLKTIRSEFPADRFELRLDANGAFSTDEALHKLDALAGFSIHSIEQPIAHGQHQALKTVCEKSSIPIALDEELIHLAPSREFLEFIKPQYLILKPGLIGGFKVADQWVQYAEELGIGWWATSALESNIGLNAIAQWCSTKPLRMPQGLGTGRLFLNNIDSPLTIENAQLIIGKAPWQLPANFLQ